MIRLQLAAVLAATLAPPAAAQGTDLTGSWSCIFDAEKIRIDKRLTLAADGTYTEDSAQVSPQAGGRTETAARITGRWAQQGDSVSFTPEAAEVQAMWMNGTDMLANPPMEGFAEKMAAGLTRPAVKRVQWVDANRMLLARDGAADALRCSRD